MTHSYGAIQHSTERAQYEIITDEGAWGAATFSRLGDGNSFFFFFLVPRWAARRIISVAVVESCTLGVARVKQINQQIVTHVAQNIQTVITQAQLGLTLNPHSWRIWSAFRFARGGETTSVISDNIFIVYI